MGGLMQMVSNDLEAYAESHGSKLETVTEADLPEVRVDLRQISHVFANLISNAVKHTSHGEPVIVAARREGDKVRFSVTDHGPGIAPEFQAQIFDRFLPGRRRTSPMAQAWGWPSPRRP